MITFGYITDGTQDVALSRSVLSVLEANITNFEILIIGNSLIRSRNTRIVNFDESQKNSWITRKKNILAEESNGDILVIMHDYIKLGVGWNQEFVDKLESSKFDVALCRVDNLDGTRFRDWCLWPLNHRILKPFFQRNLRLLIPYQTQYLNSLQYVSGSVFIAQRTFMLANPFNESKSWGEGEDIEWSCKLRDHWQLKMFPEATFQCGKQKDLILDFIDRKRLCILYIYVSILKFTPGRIKLFLTYQ